MISKKKIFLVFIAVVAAFTLCFTTVKVIKHHQKIVETGLSNDVPYGFGKTARVILIGGQSNAAGTTRDDYLKLTSTPEKYAEYEEGYDNVYINYFASGTNESRGFVKCRNKQGEKFEPGFFGPELGMAEKLNELYPDETVFIIKWAWGGTNLFDQWRSPSGGTGAGPLYQSFIAFVKNSVEYLELKNYDVKIEAMCWMQGESDSIEEDKALEYGKNLANLINDVRLDLAEYASDDGIAFIDAYIADSFFWTHYRTVNAAKQAVADSSPINVAIDTIAHGLTITEEPHENPDIAHYDSQSEIKLGHLFAAEVVKFFDEQ